MRPSRLAEHVFRDPLQREPPFLFTTAVTHGPVRRRQGCSQFERLTEAWLHRLFSLVLFEPLL